MRSTTTTNGRIVHRFGRNESNPNESVQCHIDFTILHLHRYEVRQKFFDKTTTDNILNKLLVLIQPPLLRWRGGDTRYKEGLDRVEGAFQLNNTICVLRLRVRATWLLPDWGWQVSYGNVDPHRIYISLKRNILWSILWALVQKPAIVSGQMWLL